MGHIIPSDDIAFASFENGQRQFSSPNFTPRREDMYDKENPRVELRAWLLE
jgi:hypothetical protein